MLKSVLKSNVSTLFDLKVREIVRKIILLCDSLDVFESVFLTQMSEAKGMGDKFKELYYTTRTDEKVQVWRKVTTGEKDRLIFDIIIITH
ncbi:MAG TPA: hypothetical protein VGK38_10510 [Prolixibacteraceae bacterium]